MMKKLDDYMIELIKEDEIHSEKMFNRMVIFVCIAVIFVIACLVIRVLPK